LIPTPIRQVLSTIQTNGVQALLMGGQACVFYGAAQVSQDVDLVLREARTPELLVELAQHFPDEARSQAGLRPLLGLAFSGEMEALREALDAEVRAEQAKDRAYWAPLRAELEAFRHAERERR
jgi:hypothetical protein